MNNEIITGLHDLINTMKTDTAFLQDVTSHLTTLSKTVKDQNVLFENQQKEVDALKTHLSTANDDLVTAKKEIKILEEALSESETKTRQRSCIFCRFAT
jgi:predicted  nucleic acid-binding Zn-ribbon protein